MQPQEKKIVSIAVIGIAFIQIVIVGVKYLNSANELKNPLIPDSLLTGIRNYSFAMMGCYFISIVLMVAYLKTKKFFWAYTVSAILILAAVAIFTMQIQSYFIDHDINQ
jgi:hypothetical protein